MYELVAEVQVGPLSLARHVFAADKVEESRLNSHQGGLVSLSTAAGRGRKFWPPEVGTQKGQPM